MKIKYYELLVVVVLMASCEKKIAVHGSPSFDVATDSAVYTAVAKGTPVVFTIKGIDAQSLAFYPGDTLHEYAYRNGRVMDVSGAGATMQFKSSVQLGSQLNQLSVLASNDFNGDYSSLTTVKAATWTDITGNFTLGTNATFKPSGERDMGDVIVPGKALYIAFKYVTKPQATNGLVRQWFIEGFALNSRVTLNDPVTNIPKPLSLSDQPHAGFRIVDQNMDSVRARSFVTLNRVTLWGNDSTGTGHDISSENWAVSGAIRLDTVDLGPDRAIALKGMLDAPQTSFTYTYIYKNTGTYKAIFIGSNNSIDGSRQSVKEITFTINP